MGFSISKENIAKGLNTLNTFNSTEGNGTTRVLFTDEEVKAAYRKMVKKYHPDRYVDSALKEQASEKLKEINAAYDTIQKMRKGEAAGPGMGGGYSSA